MQLYGLPISTYCAKVQVVLRHKGLAAESLPPPGGYGSPEYRAIVPMGTIPGLVDGAVVLSESEAIVEYLEERHPAPPMLFGDAASRAHIRTLSRIHDCWVEPQLRALFPHMSAHMAPAARDPAFVAARVADLHRRLGALADAAIPAPFIAGEQLSLADCAWSTTFAQADLMLPVLGHALEVPASLRPWRALLDAHESVKPTLDDCIAAMQDWIATKTGATR